MFEAGPPHREGIPTGGWINQLVAAVWWTIAQPSWRPWARLVLTATIAVGLYLAVRIFG